MYPKCLTCLLMSLINKLQTKYRDWKTQQKSLILVVLYLNLSLTLTEIQSYLINKKANLMLIYENIMDKQPKNTVKNLTTKMSNGNFPKMGSSMEINLWVEIEKQSIK